jgi:hypothetical protein
MRRFLLTLAVGPAVAAAVQVGGQPPPKPPVADPPPAVASSLAALKAVGAEGAGNDTAAVAWKALVKTGNAALLPTLTAFDGATPTAANWLRSAVSAIAENAENGGQVLDKAALAAFATDAKQNPAARRVAYELLAKADRPAAEKLLSNFLNDPQPDLRRDAVAARLKAVEPLTGEKAVAALREVLGFARDEDQVKAITKKLDELKAPVNLTKHYGYITEWVVSPAFDNKDGVGFAKAYEPEMTTDRKGWKYAQSNDPGGVVDLNKAVVEKKNLVVYASATVVADADGTLDVRASSANAVKLLVNGKEVYFREEYHSGAYLDQHVATVKLVKGKNEILVKVCQNDNPAEWAKPWGFSARLSDGTGQAIRLKQVIVKDGKEATVEVGELAPPDPKKPDADKKGGQ